MNGFHNPDRLGQKGLIDRTQYVRLIQQALHRLGFSDVAQQLEKSSGIQMQPSEATQFQKKILEGDWAGALQLLPQLTDSEQVRTSATFLILQQKYIEALEEQDFNTALHCLRSEMAPLTVDQAQLHHLASLLLCPASEDSQTRSAWLQGGRSRRPQLMSQLQAQLPPTLIIPDGRLERLVEQALLSQVAKCQYHNAVEMQVSLFSDYQAGVESLPTVTHQILEQHQDEVWHIVFSHDGSMLASASKDATAIIWKLQPSGEFTMLHVLGGHSEAVRQLAWSPDDSLLLTCCERDVQTWSTATGTRVHTPFRAHTDVIEACAWMPDGQRWVSGGVDRLVIVVEAATGREVQRLKRRTRVRGLCVTPNGTCLILAEETQIQIIRLSDHREVTIQESAPITSIAIDPSSTGLLASLRTHTVHLWNLEALTRPYPSGSGDEPDPFDTQQPIDYECEFQVNEGEAARNVLGVEFGGSNSNFVVQSSEDCKVHIWHRGTGEHLLALEGHSSTVNAVSWNPRHPHLLASASDDHTIRIWISPAAQNRQLQ